MSNELIFCSYPASGLSFSSMQFSRQCKRSALFPNHAGTVKEDMLGSHG